jgi:ribonuclease-3
MQRLERLIGHRFKDPELLKEALTHKSFASEHKSERHNERLEFLGDAVLGLFAVHYLYAHNPDTSEGRLSKFKSYLVSEQYLNIWANDLDLGKSLRLGIGEDASGGRGRSSILSDALEALIGAI